MLKNFNFSGMLSRKRTGFALVVWKLSNQEQISIKKCKKAYLNSTGFSGIIPYIWTKWSIHLERICKCCIASAVSLGLRAHSGHLNFFRGVTLIGAAQVMFDTWRIILIRIKSEKWEIIYRLTRKFMAMSSQFIFRSTQSLMDAGMTCVYKWL